MPAAHRVFSNLKTSGLGVYHGLRRKHLQVYLNGFVFPFDRRKSRHAAFVTLLSIAAGSQSHTYNMLKAVGSASAAITTMGGSIPHTCAVIGLDGPPALQIHPAGKSASNTAIML
jgi:hypothetical protein